MPWDDWPTQGTVDFFLQRMDDHTQVRRVESHSRTRHDLTLIDGTEVKVFITDAYTFSASDYMQLRARHPEVNCILSSSSYRHFSTQAREDARADGVATFHIGDLMGALHRRGTDFLDYPVRD
jgi:hypothetical protein